MWPLARSSTTVIFPLPDKRFVDLEDLAFADAADEDLLQPTLCYLAQGAKHVAGSTVVAMAHFLSNDS